MASQTCRVTFTDLKGISHSVEVSANSLYEAAALAVKALKSAPFVDQVPGPASRLEIEVKVPAVKHTVSVQQVKAWIESGSSDPRESNKKKELAEVLGLK